MIPDPDPTRDRWRLSLERDLWVLLYVVVVVISLRIFVDPDLAGHLAYGLEHLRTGQLARVDTYSYSAPGAAWVNHEWAFEWLMAWLYTYAGPTGLILLQVAGWGAVGALVMILARRSSRDVIAGGLVYILLASTTAGSMGIRPQLATYVLFPVLVLLLEKARCGETRTLFVVPPLFVLWANPRGAFPAGLGVLGLHAAGHVADSVLGRSPRADHAVPPQQAGKLALAMAVTVPASLLAKLINTYGSGLWRWMVGSLGTARPQIADGRRSRLMQQAWPSRSLR